MKVKRMFAKPIAILMAVCMVIQLNGVVTAESVSNDIVVTGVTDEQKVQLITDTINGEILISPFGIACLFGHSTAKGIAYETNHCYYTTAPKCRRTTYDVTYCTRSSCNYIVYTQIGATARISCCA